MPTNKIIRGLLITVKLNITTVDELKKEKFFLFNAVICSEVNKKLSSNNIKQSPALLLISTIKNNF